MSMRLVFPSCSLVLLLAPQRKRHHRSCRVEAFGNRTFLRFLWCCLNTRKTRARFLRGKLEAHRNSTRQTQTRLSKVNRTKKIQTLCPTFNWNTLLQQGAHLRRILPQAATSFATHIQAGPINRFSHTRSEQAEKRPIGGGRPIKHQSRTHATRSQQAEITNAHTHAHFHHVRIYVHEIFFLLSSLGRKPHKTHNRTQ